MTSKLEQNRRAFVSAKQYLAWANRVQSLRHKSDAMRMINRTRSVLIDEINTVRWKVWPKTGRPYYGEWRVAYRVDGWKRYLVQGPQSVCLKTIETANTYGAYRVYWIEKADDPV